MIANLLYMFQIHEEGHNVQLYNTGRNAHIPLTQHAGEVAEGVEASVGYGVYNSKTLVSANRQPEAETFILSHCRLSQPPQALTENKR